RRSRPVDRNYHRLDGERRVFGPAHPEVGVQPGRPDREDEVEDNRFVLDGPRGQVEGVHGVSSHARTVTAGSSFWTPAVTTSCPGFAPAERTTVSCRYSRTSTGVRVRPPDLRSTTQTAGRSPARNREESGRTYPGAASAGARWTVAVIPRTTCGPGFWI